MMVDSFRASRKCFFSGKLIRGFESDFIQSSFFALVSREALDFNRIPLNIKRLFPNICNKISCAMSHRQGKNSPLTT